MQDRGGTPAQCLLRCAVRRFGIYGETVVSWIVCFLAFDYLGVDFIPNHTHFTDVWQFVLSTNQLEIPIELLHVAV